MATLLCPTAAQAERVAEKFGLTAPGYEAIHELHARVLGATAARPAARTQRTPAG